MTVQADPVAREYLDLRLDFDPKVPCEAPNCIREALWYGFRACCDHAEAEGKPIVAVCEECRQIVLRLLSLGFGTKLLFGKCPYCKTWISADSVKFVPIKEGHSADA